MKINEWEYKFNNLIITPDKEIAIPTKLYKYYSLDQNSIDSLVNSYIYATHPSEFNDVFDCDADLLDFDNENFTNYFLYEFMKRGIHEFENIKIELKYIAQRDFKESVYRKFGIFCMTNNPKSLYMWTNYNKHKGFCIEFDISVLNKNFKAYGPFPINYQPSEKIIPLSVSKFNNIGEDTYFDILLEMMLFQSNIKNEFYEYEEEWRLLIQSPKGNEMVSPSYMKLKELGGHNRKFEYPIETIKSIWLGVNFFLPEEKKIEDYGHEINLIENYTQKLAILDFLSDNKIPTLIGGKNKPNEINFEEAIIERVNYKQFKVIYKKNKSARCH